MSTSDGNVWVTDAAVASKAAHKGEQVIKLSPEGKVLMRLGTAGVSGGGPTHFHDPGDVITAPNGDIFVADGHGTVAPDLPPDTITRIIKFTPDGKFIKAWGSLGSGKSQFRNPHALVFDSQGRLLVADRVNGRIQVFDQDGKYLTEYRDLQSSQRAVHHQGRHALCHRLQQRGPEGHLYRQRQDRKGQMTLCPTLKRAKAWRWAGRHSLCCHAHRHHPLSAEEAAGRTETGLSALCCAAQHDPRLRARLIELPAKQKGKHHAQPPPFPGRPRRAALAAATAPALPGSIPTDADIKFGTTGSIFGVWRSGRATALMKMSTNMRMMLEDVKHYGLEGFEPYSGQVVQYLGKPHGT